jgi:hypothetical protein
LAREEEIAGRRRLSCLFYMAQWGCLPLIDQRRARSSPTSFVLFALTIETGHTPAGRREHTLTFALKKARLI